MDKYIVKNCPAYAYCHCKSVTYSPDCLIKQVIEKCKVANRVLYDGDYIKVVDTNKNCREILQLFDIEECE